ncbi:MAG: sugar ABC transporter ATP-binding protein, partial [Synergistes sp.]|nr:sugar ABC transporter ATP-binding protein [Synergistes sp.]
LDEPTSALTEAEVDKMYELIDDMKSREITILYISHRLDEILKLADHITVMKDGEHVITMENSAEVTKNMLIKYMVGREVAYKYDLDAAKISDEVLLKTTNLCSGKSLKSASMEVRKGEVLGIAGLEGSGKTELLETIFGWRKKTSGTIEVNGVEKNIRSTIDAKKSKMAYITKERKTLGLFLGLDVRDNISAAANKKLSVKGFVNYPARKKNAIEYVDRMQIKVSGLDQKTANLSGGNQQKVLLSMWMSDGPDILLIDEPTRGVDVGAKSEIHEHIRNIAANGKAVAIISSEMPELMAVCDRIVVMHEGTIVGELGHKEYSEEVMMQMASGIV